MDTLLKHNNEVQDNLMKLWDKYKEKLGLGEYSDEITLHITSQNTELLKKIAKGEIERLEKMIKNSNYGDDHVYDELRRQEYGHNNAIHLNLTHWQQVLQDLER